MREKELVHTEFDATATKVSGKRWPYNELTLRCSSGSFEERMEGRRYHVILRSMEPERIEFEGQAIKQMHEISWTTPIMILPSDVKCCYYHVTLKPVEPELEPELKSVEPELKPCAHCGLSFPNVYKSRHASFHVRCNAMYCLARTAWFTTRAEAIAAWNRRAN